MAARFPNARFSPGPHAAMWILPTRPDAGTKLARASAFLDMREVRRTKSQFHGFNPRIDFRRTAYEEGPLFPRRRRVRFLPDRLRRRSASRLFAEREVRCTHRSDCQGRSETWARRACSRSAWRVAVDEV